MELLVVDSNVVLSSIISRGHSFLVFFLNYSSNKLNFVAPQYVIEELKNHANELIEKSKLPSFIVQEDFEFILEKIKLIPESVYENRIEEAREILKGHEKDAPYLALALKFNCKIFSGDKTLKSIILDNVITPKELLEQF